MLSTASWVAQSLRRPVFDEVVDETSAMSTGRRRAVARRDSSVKMATTVTAIDRSRGF